MQVSAPATALRCPFCGDANRAGFAACPSCGGVVRPSGDGGAFAAPPPLPAPSTVDDLDLDAQCASCGGVKTAPGRCPWCGVQDEGRPLTAEEAEELRVRRRRILRRTAVVTAVLAVLGVLGAGGAAAWERRQQNSDWKRDRAAAGTKVASVLRDLPLDPAERSPSRLRNAKVELERLASALAEDEGNGKARRALADRVNAVSNAVGTVAQAADVDWNDLESHDLAPARLAWADLGDDVDAISKTTGAKIDLPATRGKVEAFLEGLLQKAQAQQRRRGLELERTSVSAHKTAVEQVFSEYESLRAQLDQAGISDYEVSEYFTPYSVLDQLEEAAEERHDLAQSLRDLQGPTPGIDARVKQMATILSELGDLLANLDDLSGECRLTSTWDYVCPTIGELPQYKQFLANTNAAYQRLVAEKHAWAAEVDAEIARLEELLRNS